MKRVFYIVVLLILHISGYAVNVETTINLNAYYPEYSKIDLVCGQMPKAAQKDVEFCCEAAFTGELLTEFKHMNIADNHICNGEMKRGYRCKANTGGFVWGKGKWKFMRKVDYPTTANGWNMEMHLKSPKPVMGSLSDHYSRIFRKGEDVLGHLDKYIIKKFDRNM